jgi:serine/threonine-protein kinase
MSARDDLVLPRDCARRYRAVRLLGSGGFGKVVEATQLSLERRVVVKLLHLEALGDPEQVARFENEARVTASLQHPNIVTLLDHGAEEGTPWIVYEFIDGQDLRAALAAGRFPVALACLSVAQVCAALEEAHGRGILHRDIKPENVLRTAEGLCKVADFGLAKWGGADSVKTRQGLLLGTPAYLSPEQIQGEPATAASDLYAVGVLLYELLTVRLPFEADSPLAMLEKHLVETALPPSAWRPELPASLDALVTRLLEKEPGARPASAALVRAGLESGSEAGPRVNSPTVRLRTGGSRSQSAQGTASLPRPLPGSAAAPKVSSVRRARGPVLWLGATALAVALLGAGVALWPAAKSPLARPPAADSRASVPPARPSSRASATATPPVRAPSPEERIERLRAHVTKFPKDWPAYLELARAYDAVGNWNWALGKYTHVASKAEPRTSPVVAQAHLGRGRCLLKQEKAGEAAEALRKALELAPGEPETLDLLSQALGETPAGRNEAIRLSQQVLAGQPDRPGLARRLVGWLVEAGRYEETAPLLEKILAREPHDRWARRHLANWYFWQGKRREALPLLEELAGANPPDREVMLMLGHGYSETHAPDRAEAHYTRGLALWPGDPEFLTGLASVQAATGRLSEAEQTYRQALAAGPERSLARIGFADVLVRLGRKPEAKKVLEEGERVAPGNTWNQVMLASLLAEEARLDEAATLYSKVLAREPLHETALVGLADLRERQGRLEDAIVLNRKLIAGLPSCWERNRQLADLLDRAGRAGEALAIRQKLRKERPETPGTAAAATAPAPAR